MHVQHGDHGDGRMKLELNVKFGADEHLERTLTPL